MVNDWEPEVNTAVNSSRKLYHEPKAKPAQSTKEGTTIKRFACLITTPVVPAFFLLTFPSTPDACLDQGTGSTILKVLAAVLVAGVFLYNHFRNQIKTLPNLFSRGRKHKRAED